MGNGSFVLGRDHDEPSVFARTVEWAIQDGIETVTFHEAYREFYSQPVARLRPLFETVLEGRPGRASRRQAPYIAGVTDSPQARPGAHDASPFPPYHRLRPPLHAAG